jgi:hypothetical protein
VSRDFVLAFSSNIFPWASDLFIPKKYFASGGEFGEIFDFTGDTAESGLSNVKHR